jgi:ADP-ribose pyrophosphatase YjhB (NUDIX family)
MVMKQWRVGVAGAVVHQGQVLLIRHTYGEKRGRWALPGGYATQEERLDQSVIRELREDMGLEPSGEGGHLDRFEQMCYDFFRSGKL